jgi:hypothetical protein
VSIIAHTPGGENCLIQIRVLAAKHRPLKAGGDHPGSSGVFQHMGFQPVLLLERPEATKRSVDADCVQGRAGMSGHIAECYAGA